MKLYEICFSPTGGTKKAASILLNGLGGELVTVDLTDSQANFSQLNLAPDDVALIAVPSYSGRVPAVAVERLSAIKLSTPSSATLPPDARTKPTAPLWQASPHASAKNWTPAALILPPSPATVRIGRLAAQAWCLRRERTA